MPDLEQSKELEFSRRLSHKKQVVFVVTRQSNLLENVVAVYSDVDQVVNCILDYAGQKYTVIRAADIEALEIDGESIIATKVMDPELRVSRCTVDPHIGPMVLS